MAAPATFSYAQAAKGQGTTPSNNPANAAESVQDSPSQDSVTKDPAAPERAADVPDAALSVDGNSNTPEKHDKDSVQGLSESVRSESVSEQQSEARRDDDVGRLERPWRRTDKGTRNSSTTTRSTEDNDSKKSRKTKKGKSSDKSTGEDSLDGNKDQEVEPEAPKIELAEAPIPTVNVWLQRKEAQLAKVQPVSNAVPAQPESTPVPEKVDEPEESSKIVEASAAEGDGLPDTGPVNELKSQRKTGDSARPERTGSRGSRGQEKEVKENKNEVPPPVGDAISWPTPETAIKDQKKTTEKTDRSAEKDTQEDAAPAKRQKDKWVHLPFTPAATFQTPLPQMRGSKPRGGARGANGTRAGAGNQSSDKTASASSQQNKSSESRDRTRETTNGANGTTHGSAAKRGSVDASTAREHRKSMGQVSVDRAKENIPGYQIDLTQDNPKDRGENRSERGRGGGFRGRGSHHTGNAHPQHQQTASTVGAPVFPGTGSITPRAHGPYSPPPRPGPHGQVFMPPPPQRGGRGGRGGAGANYHRLSLPAGRLPPVQTQFGSYEYPMAPMSSIPFQTPQYWDSVMFNMLRSQVEYYFSIENLCKDMYLRKRMDSQGFVPLHFIAAFKRVRELSGEGGLTMVRAACEMSNDIDYVVGEDDIERLRRRENWQQWLVRWEERDEGARNNGPMHFTFKSRGYQFGHQFNGMPPMPYAMASPSAYGMQGEQPFMPYMADPQQGQAMQMPNGVGAQADMNGASRQLSADVPDFSPSGSVMFGQQAEPTQFDAGSFTMSPMGNGSEYAGQQMPNGFHGDGMPVQAVSQP